MLSATQSNRAAIDPFGARQGWTDCKYLKIRAMTGTPRYAMLFKIKRPPRQITETLHSSRPTNLNLHEDGGGLDAVMVQFSRPCIDPSPNWRKLK